MIAMTNFQDAVDILLSECNRHCCLCRRFKPLHLQVHHIEPLAEGGTNNPDNLIALCLNCHSSVHSKLSMAKNFSYEELKMSRDKTIELVKSGKLVENEESSGSTELLSELIAAILPALAKPDAPKVNLIPEAFELLMAAVEFDGLILIVHYDGGYGFSCGSKQFGMPGCDPRIQSKYRNAFDQIARAGLVDVIRQGSQYSVSEDGYLLLDQIKAAQQLKAKQS